MTQHHFACKANAWQLKSPSKTHKYALPEKRWSLWLYQSIWFMLIRYGIKKYPSHKHVIKGCVFRAEGRVLLGVYRGQTVYWFNFTTSDHQSPWAIDGNNDQLWLKPTIVSGMRKQIVFSLLDMETWDTTLGGVCLIRYSIVVIVLQMIINNSLLFKSNCFCYQMCSITSRPFCTVKVSWGSRVIYIGNASSSLLLL